MPKANAGMAEWIRRQPRDLQIFRAKRAGGLKARVGSNPTPGAIYAGVPLARSTGAGLGPAAVGLRGFKSHPPHYFLR